MNNTEEIMYAARMDSTPALASRAAVPVAETVAEAVPEPVPESCLLTLILSLSLISLPAQRKTLKS